MCCGLTYVVGRASSSCNFDAMSDLSLMLGFGRTVHRRCQRVERARDIEILGIHNGAVCMYAEASRQLEVAEHIYPMSLGNLRQNTNIFHDHARVHFCRTGFATTDNLHKLLRRHVPPFLRRYLIHSVADMSPATTHSFRILTRLRVNPLNIDLAFVS